MKRWSGVLFNSLPILGAGLRHLAILRLCSLAKASQPGAAGFLAQALSLPLNPASKHRILHQLSAVDRQQDIDDLWYTWLSGRSPLIYQILQTLTRPASEKSAARAASLLALNQFAELVEATSLEIDQLVELVGHPEDILFDSARSVLLQLRSTAAIERLCEKWVDSRAPVLEQIIRTANYRPRKAPQAVVMVGLLLQDTSLILEASANQVATLVQACSDPNASIQELARQCLLNLQNQDGVDEICRLWYDSRLPLLLQAIQKARYQAEQPLKIRIYSSLLNGHLELARQATPEGVDFLFSAFRDPDPALSTPARAALLDLKNPASRDAVCRRFTSQADPLAQQLAEQAGYLPEAIQERVLFLFLCARFDQYDLLDFDCRSMQATYAMANLELKRRIIRLVQQSGKTAYLSILSGLDVKTAHRAWEDEEIGAFLHTLEANQEWERLWQEIPHFTLAWAVKGIKTLSGASWLPEAEIDRPVFQELVDLANQPLALTRRQLDQLPLPLLRRAVLKVSGRVNDLDFSPTGTQLAIGTGARRLGLWDFQHARITRVLSGFNHSISRVSFLPDGHLTCGQRSANSALCSIYGWENDTAFLLGSHQGAVTDLDAAGEGHILSTGRDGRLVLWDLPARRQLAERVFPTWPRALAVAPGYQKAAVLTERIQLVSLPDLELLPFVVRTPAGSRVRSSIPCCAAFDPNTDTLVVGQYNGQVAIYDKNPGSTTIKKELLHTYSEPLVSSRFIPGHPFLITASQKGSIKLTHWPEKLLYSELNLPEGKLTSLQVSPDGSFLATGVSADQIILWDLRCLDYPELVGPPLPKINNHQFSIIQLLKDEPGLPEPARNALKISYLLLNRRFRLDIEIGEVPSIRAGEFDIIIE